MSLHFETGHPIQGDVQRLDANIIRVVNEEGRCLFEIRVAGLKTIEVTGVEMVKVDGAVCGSSLMVMPRASNVAEVSVVEYGAVK